MAWNSSTSTEERLADVALGLLLVAFVACCLVWAAAEVSGFLTHRAWPPLGLGDAPAVAWGLIQHPRDPTRGWPPSARRLAPTAWALYGLLGLMVTSVLAIGIAITGRLFSAGGDHGGVGRVPSVLRRWPNTRWEERPFLGWVGWGPLTRVVVGGPEDCVAVIGPPRVGKTQGVLIPQIYVWGGSVVAASTKRDVMAATAARRQELAMAHGGRVMLWAPTATTAPPPRIQSIGWSPLSGCESSETCERRVRALVASSNAGTGARYADHWRENAVRVLRGYFHAAAIDRQGVRGVLRWLSHNEIRDPAVILRATGSLVGEAWADELEGMERVPPQELGSIFSAARTALGALQNGRVLASCEGGAQLDVDHFLCSRSTLYFVAPTADQDLLAPLAAALVEHIVQRAYELWDEGALPSRCLLNLDELVNIAPLPTLLKILTQGASQGVNLAWAVQSLAQFRDRYGEQVADAAFSSTRARLVFGGLMDARDLQAISQLAGEHEVPARSHTRGGQPGQQTVTAGTVWRPRVPVSTIRGIPAGRAMLLYHTSDPSFVRVRLAHRVRLWHQRRGESARPGSPSALRWARRWRRG